MSLIQLKLENTGNQPIPAADFERPMVLVFPAVANVIEAAVIETSPPNIRMPTTVAANMVTINSALLNPKDRVIFRILVANMPPGQAVQPFSLDTRIAGIPLVRVVTAIQEASSAR